MILDQQTEFSDAQAVTATAISTNVLDLTQGQSGLTTIDVGEGETIFLVVQTQTTATDSSSDATLTVSLESDSTTDLATSATVHFTTGALAFAAFATAGTRLCCVALPRQVQGVYERYLGVRYTVASGPLTAGKFDAFLTKDPNSTRVYQSGFTVA